jgi:hypothetical protein
MHVAKLDYVRCSAGLGLQMDESHRLAFMARRAGVRQVVKVGLLHSFVGGMFGIDV